MNPKIVKKGTETGKWHDTSICFESVTKSGIVVWCMFERAINQLITVNRDTFRGKAIADPKKDDRVSYYIRIDKQIVGDLVPNEYVLHKGKKKLDRKEFVKHYNFVRMEVINQTVYLEP